MGAESGAIAGIRVFRCYSVAIFMVPFISLSVIVGQQSSRMFCPKRASKLEIVLDDSDFGIGGGGKFGCVMRMAKVFTWKFNVPSRVLDCS